MPSRMFIVTLLTLLLVVPSQVFAASAPLELKWSELNAVVGGQKVELKLPDGVTVGGSVAEIREDALVLNVWKTSDSKAHPKGGATIPRSSVSLLKLTKRKGTHWQLIGTVAGFFAGPAIAGAVNDPKLIITPAALSVFLFGTPVLAVVGNRVGHKMDYKTITIRVVE